MEDKAVGRLVRWRGESVGRAKMTQSTRDRVSVARLCRVAMVWLDVSVLPGVEGLRWVGYVGGSNVV